MRLEDNVLVCLYGPSTTQLYGLQVAIPEETTLELLIFEAPDIYCASPHVGVNYWSRLDKIVKIKIAIILVIACENSFDFYYL